jgi:hypothetical protein
VAGVKVKFDGDKTQLEQAYRDLAASHAKLENQVARLGQVSAKASKEQLQGQSMANSALRAGADEIKAMAAQWVSVGSVIAAAKAELSEFQQIQDAAARETVAVGQGQSKLLFNLAGNTGEERAGVLSELLKIQKDSNFPDVKQLYDAAASALAATGSRIEPSLDIVRAVAPLARNAPGEASDIALGAATIQEVIGGTAKEAIGFMSTIGGPSYITDPAKQAQYIPAAIKSAVETVKTDGPDGRKSAAAEIGAAMSALGVIAGDVRGQSSRTEIIDLAVEMRDFFTKGIEVDVGGRKVRKKFGADPGGFNERIEFLQNNDRARKAFLEQTTGEQQFSVAREELLNKNGITAQKYREFLPQIRADERDYAGLVGSQTSGSEQLIAATEKGRQEAIQQQRAITRPQATRESLAREIRDKTLAETRRYGAMPFGLKFASESTATGIDDLRGVDPVDSAISSLETRAKQIRSRRGILGGVDSLAPSIPDDQLSKRQREDLGFVNEQLDQLRKLRDEQRRPAGADAATGGNLLHAIKEQTRLAAEHGSRQEKLTEEQTKAMHELIRQQANKRPIGAPQDEIGRHKER